MNLKSKLMREMTAAMKDIKESTGRFRLDRGAMRTLEATAHLRGGL